MDDLNDIRLALSALTTNMRELRDQVDDIGAHIARSRALAELLDDLDAMLGELPASLRAIGDDPMYGMILGGPCRQLADGIEEMITSRRARRAAPPAIERA